MKLSILMITYNHGKFIAQALESVLMQKVNFEYEIVLGEDNSVDNTRTIVEAFKSNYSDKISLYLQKTNVGVIENFCTCFNACKGDYIALLEGDDYWTDPHKLQDQVDYLDNHPECSLCFHPVQAIYEGVKGGPAILYPRKKSDQYSIEDLLRENFIQTCSVVFRNGLFDNFPDWFYEAPFGDWPPHILNAQHGKIGYIENVMGAYRIHAGGYWSAKAEVDKIKKTMTFLRMLNSHLHTRYDRCLKQSLLFYRFKIKEKEIGLLLKKIGLKSVINAYRSIFYPAVPKE